MSRVCGLVAAVDQVALLRGGNREPDPVHFALQAELAGASGIRAHLRIDRRNIGNEDVELLNRMVKSAFFLQVSPHQDIVHLVNGLRPANLIMSAERRDEFVSENGLDATLLSGELQGIIRNIDPRQTKVYLLVEPELGQVKAAAKLGVFGLVLNVRELMVDNRGGPHYEKRLTNLKDTVKLAGKYNMDIHFAGGIIAERIPELVQIQGVSAIHVNHQLVARAMLVGVYEAVRSYLELM